MKSVFLFLTFFITTGSVFAQSNDGIIAIQQSEIRTLRETIRQMSNQLKALDVKAASLEQGNTRVATDLSRIKSGQDGFTGNLTIDGNVAIDAGAGWHRSYGNSGWYNGTHGGGWHMSDSTWIRSYGSKNVYSDQTIRADNGFQVDGNYVIDGNGRIPQLDALKSLSLYDCPCVAKLTTIPFCTSGWPVTFKPCTLVGTFLTR